MIHQYEEHDGERLAAFLNGMMGAGKRGVSPAAIWVINVIFVWFLLLTVFHLATLSPGCGVLAAYLLAINGILHVIWAANFRKYNPGLWTSILLFIPIAVWIIASVPAALSIHVVSAVLVILLHAGIMIFARRPI